MNKQKAVLVGLIVILIAVVAVGATTIGFNHTGHGTTETATKTETPAATDKTEPTEKAEPSQSSPKAEVDDKQLKQQQAATEQALTQLKNGVAMIKEGTGLMANDAYVGQQQGQVSMDKVHQGIYKMAQGTLLVDQAMGAVDQNLLTAQLQQQLQQQLALQQQLTQQMQQTPQGQAGDPNSAHSAATHSTSTSTGQIVTYAIYAFMVISFVGVFAGITGLIRNLFKPAAPVPGGEQNG